ncbi:SDR family oxidoreductase [Lapillicoccus sp.]|uniref:SDR family oxidoreductase n=1 Tax=Lapillicoccus sp. TaxID=1909287 RepID=UPI0025DE196C|nr:SDR family oxidoreductase [Lapillicoccus sp.]
MPYAAGSTAVVTGAAGGIGRAIATRLVAEGFRVVVADLDPAVAETAGALGDDVVAAFAGDCASEAGVADLITAAQEQLGHIDVFFANAGVEGGRGLEATEDQWARAIEVNVMAHVRTARLLVPTWLETGGGRLVVTASAAGLLTMLGSAPYSVSKHGAVAFAEWLRATYSHRGIVVQAICPQGVRTRMLDDSGPLRDLLSRDRALEPSEVADLVWEALQDERFLVLPHPEVAGYYAARASDPDAWLGAMGRLQVKLDTALAEDADRAPAPVAAGGSSS